MSTLNIVETVGSDHHPFDRLIGWTDNWASKQLSAIELSVQHGTAEAPRHGEATAYLPHPTLMHLLKKADVVITQGGPMGIVETRRLGLKPIVVPRLKAFGEVVDDHQVDLCRRLADRGDIWIAEDEGALHHALDIALANPSALRFDPVDAEAGVEESVARFAQVVANLPSPSGPFGWFTSRKRHHASRSRSRALQR